MEATRSITARIDIELVCDGGNQNGKRQFGLLPTRLSRAAVVAASDFLRLAVDLQSGKVIPIANIDHFVPPDRSVLIGQALDECLDAQKPCFVGFVCMLK